MIREGLSKKTRFTVFKRDYFTCQYCGNTPPQVVLEVDHIHPVSKGGKNATDNLITACFDCNRGKSADLLTSIPQTIIHKHEVLAEREAQIKAFNKLLKAKRKREDIQIYEIEQIFCGVFENREFTPVFRNSIRQNFLPFIDHDTLLNAISKACSQCNYFYDATKYFCGICWNIRRPK